ncbi:MAG: hypothetical protein AB7T07_15615 [Steroidobacteraceae bacterium]
MSERCPAVGSFDKSMGLAYSTWVKPKKEAVATFSNCFLDEDRQALPHRFLQQQRVRFTAATAFISELVEAANGSQLSHALNRWERLELIFIDEMGYN